MGGVLLTFGFDPKIKTVEQAKKDFSVRADDDRYENGHSYSGSMGMLRDLRYVDQVFDTEEDFERFLESKYKDDGYLARVRVIRVSKPLERARKLVNEISQQVRAANLGYVYQNWQKVEFKKTPAQKRALQAKLDKAIAKRDALFKEAVGKSTKTRFIGGGIASS